MLHMAKFAVCSEVRTKSINAVSEENEKFVSVTFGGT